MSDNRKLTTREKVAAGVSVTMLAVMAVYWVIQIQGVMELLEMAYG